MPIDLRFLFSRQLSILGSYMGRKDELFTILKLMGQRRLRPVIDRVLPLAECRRAHEILRR